MRNMYADRVACGVKGRESAMTASSDFKRSRDYRNKPRHIKFHCFKFLRESDRRSLPLGGAERCSWCSLLNTDPHDNSNYYAEQQ